VGRAVGEWNKSTCPRPIVESMRCNRNLQAATPAAPLPTWAAANLQQRRPTTTCVFTCPSVITVQKISYSTTSQLLLWT
jgi:hypothetical protein